MKNELLYVLESNKLEMQKFAKNYIPILFNIYITENKQDNQDKTRLAVLETIKTYFKITETSVCYILNNIFIKIKFSKFLTVGGNFL